MEQWYTLYTKPNTEYQVATALQKRGIQTYLPTNEYHQAGQGQKRKPFFPCYLFIKVDFEAVGLLGVRWTPGLRYVVAFGDQPVPLPDEVINLIQRKLDRTNASGQPAHAFQPGDTVRIINGPLQGLLALFEKSTTTTERVQVLLTFLGRTNRAWVPVTDLETVQPEAKAPAPKQPRCTRGCGRRIKNS